MLINIYCSKHPNQKLEARFEYMLDLETVLVIEPCPECHAVDEWTGYQDGLNDRKRDVYVPGKEVTP